MTGGRDGAAEFSYPVDFESLPKAGRSFELNATKEECAAVAKRLDLLGLETLSATLHLMRTSGGFITVKGRFAAQLSQACVITLQPVRANVGEAVSMTFMDAPDLKSVQAVRTGTEDIISVDDDDPPELVNGGRIDLGELVVEQLILALDPYPRAEGASFDAKSWGSEDGDRGATSANPFAALEKLKKT